MGKGHGRGDGGRTWYRYLWVSVNAPTTPEYKYNDKINLKATIHNTGDVDATDDVLVYFYENDPDYGGSLIGSATISGGIPKGEARTAVLNNYTVQSSSVNIFVKVDPLDSILEKDESNNNAFRTLSIGPTNFDSDGDGLTDYDETEGMRTAFGVINTFPNNPDTDGDGLSDGQEMGARLLDYYLFISDPRTNDTDDDKLHDLGEFSVGTNPRNQDTDTDKLLDGVDPYPLIPDFNYVSETMLEIARAVVLGAAFGETGIEGGSLHYLVGDISSSPFYVVGWIGFSLIPVVGAVADARDAVQALVNGDMLGAALNAVGAIPGPGDAAKVANVIGLFIKKNPDKVKETAMVIMLVFRKYANNDINLASLDKLFDGAATALKDKGVSVTLIGELGEKGIDLLKLKNDLDKASTIPRIGNVGAEDIIHLLLNKKIDIEKTLGLIKRSDGSVSWLEEGLTAAEAAKLPGKTGAVGWKHIFEDHIIDYNVLDKNEFAKAFDPTGTNYRNAKSIRNLIFESVKEGKIDSNTGICYYKVTSEHYVKTIIGSNGFIITSHPIRKLDVPLYLR